MTVQDELESIVREVKAYRWTPELFDKCQKFLHYADVFNILRRELLPDEYEQFDLMYCNHLRPQDEALNRWLMKIHKKEGGIMKTGKKEVMKSSEGNRNPRHQFRGFPENW